MGIHSMAFPRQSNSCGRQGGKGSLHRALGVSGQAARALRCSLSLSSSSAAPGDGGQGEQCVVPISSGMRWLSLGQPRDCRCWNHREAGEQGRGSTGRTTLPGHC